MLAFVLVACAGAQDDDDGSAGGADGAAGRPPDNQPAPDKPMDINLNSTGGDDVAHCSILPANFSGMQRSLSAGGLFDPLKDQGDNYAEYYVASGKNQAAAIRAFRSACTANHGTAS